ncbi:MAG: Na+-transporting oxaloacetate decarboxylase subunit gamma [Epsilonproteobacteria bacterium]|nr:MAG: Na+-transporting oxaloacetate decarboxylase subunit gamma [Campylobacterota bacterium]
MEEANLLLESLKFMVLGMTVVFTFLVILILVVNFQAKIIAKFFPEEAPVAPNTADKADEAHHVAAIIAAVAEFRKNK